MRAFPTAAAIAVAIGLSLPAPVDAGPKKKEKDPDWIEFVLLRDGNSAGKFGFKTTRAASGQVFTSSELEMKVKRGGLAIQTHVERDPPGRLVKYRKWVGAEGARPDLIAFWKGKKLRVVSKLKGKRFNKDLSPADGFVCLDRLGFHLYSYLAQSWAQSQPAELPAVSLHDAKLTKVALKKVGVATFKNKAGEEVTAQAVSVKAKGFSLTMFVGEKPIYLGFQGKKMLMLRKGWNLVSVEEETGTPVDGADGKDPVDATGTKKPGDAQEDPEEDPTEDAEEDAKEGSKEDLPPLPE